MKVLNVTTALVMTGLFAAVPAFAQTTTAPTSTVAPAATPAAADAQKQHVDGGDSPSNPRATEATA